MPSSPLPSSPSDTPIREKIGTVEQDRSKMAKNRPYYSPDNALLFKDVFDLMIKERQDREIISSLAGFKPNTLYTKAQDALKWLAECHSEKEKYAKLRGQVSMTRRNDGIKIYFKPTISKILQDSSMIAQEQRLWKEEVEEWLKTAQPLQLWDSIDKFPEGVVVSEDDKKWLTDLLAGIEGCEADIQTRRVRIMR